MLPWIFLFIFLIDALWGVLVVSSKREVYTARFSSIWVIQILKRASLVRLRPVVYLPPAFYTHSKPTLAFSVKVTYTPPLAYLKLRKL